MDQELKAEDKQPQMQYSLYLDMFPTPLSIASTRTRNWNPTAKAYQLERNMVRTSSEVPADVVFPHSIRPTRIDEDERLPDRNFVVWLPNKTMKLNLEGIEMLNCIGQAAQDKESRTTGSMPEPLRRHAKQQIAYRNLIPEKARDDLDELYNKNCTSGRVQAKNMTISVCQEDWFNTHKPVKQELLAPPLQEYLSDEVEPYWFRCKLNETAPILPKEESAPLKADAQAPVAISPRFMAPGKVPTTPAPPGTSKPATQPVHPLSRTWARTELTEQLSRKTLKQNTDGTYETIRQPTPEHWVKGEIKALSTDPITDEELQTIKTRWDDCHWGPIEKAYDRALEAGAYKRWTVDELCKEARLFRFAIQRALAHNRGKLRWLSELIEERGKKGMGETVEVDFYGESDKGWYCIKTFGDMVQSWRGRLFLDDFADHYGQTIDQVAISDWLDLPQFALTPNALARSGWTDQHAIADFHETLTALLPTELLWQHTNIAQNWFWLAGVKRYDACCRLRLKNGRLGCDNKRHHFDTDNNVEDWFC
ncbi:MAG: hypothetical protein NZ777_14645, partial [Pseudomonadales bacterium]|nr:hypothetical protein [Pseudomonadales bacterium]